MNVRPAEYGDMRAWISLNREFMAYELADSGFWNNVNERPDSEFETVFKEALGKPEHISIFIIEEDGEAIGFANLLTIFSVWAGGTALIVDDLFLKEEHRGNGFGRRTMEFIEEYAKDRGYKRIQFQSELSNPEACEFYKALGYESESMNFYIKHFN